jgi:putative oxidoreductase
MRTIVNQISRACYDHGLGLLLIRVVAGLIFTVHGWQKWQNLPSFIHFFGMIGFAPWVAYFIAGLELIGGLLLILGVATRFFGLLFGIEMLVAAARVGVPHGFMGYEFELLLSAVSFGLALAGSGKFSLFKMECNQCGGMMCKAHR